jgi:hypothetical protein
LEQGCIVIWADLPLARPPERDERFTHTQACNDIALTNTAELKKLEEFCRWCVLSFAHGKEFTIPVNEVK